MRVVDALLPVRPGLTEEELALLAHSELVADAPDGFDDELGQPGPPGFRERLARGDISW
jgi:hypothetical protein